MKEYVERKKVIHLINKVKNNFSPNNRTILDAIIGCINMYVPSADVAPVVHGEWTHRRWTTECDWGCINHRSVICSVCGTEFVDKESTNYCPECGAKMKEGEIK